ncbi:uncharacterized protein LOC128955277 [Oppia nitens]|uniref:uncharacterized protein LOC128955277 n=1 Tax=Oppia nitens TaxID=1686743 RepID=UPI0023DB8232|nr:uncharacterized protein LOC128955277 [Oppia nitens]
MSKIAASLALASKGCQAMDTSDDYIEAIGLLTKAIELNPSDFRYYANRSLAFYRLNRYEMAAQDALKAVRLNPRCPANYVRLAAALNGRRRYRDAEVAALRALALEPTLRIAAYELLMARKMALISVGFDKHDVLQVIANCNTIDDGFGRLLKLIQMKDI